VSKSSLSSPDADTPIRRPADTLPRSAAHFQRNNPLYARRHTRTIPNSLQGVSIPAALTRKKC